MPQTLPLSALEQRDEFIGRHIGPSLNDIPAMLEAIGGYFETWWSVNPMWTASYTSLPSHPITNGIYPFSLRDEWYFNMRFAEHGVTIKEVLSDNHRSYTASRHFAEAITTLGVTHRTIKAYCPWQNGKVERFHRTLATGWAYAQPYTSNDQRTQALPAWLNDYNLERKHYGIGGQTPISRLHPSTTC